MKKPEAKNPLTLSPFLESHIPHQGLVWPSLLICGIAFVSIVIHGPLTKALNFMRVICDHGKIPGGGGGWRDGRFAHDPEITFIECRNWNANVGGFFSVPKRAGSLEKWTSDSVEGSIKGIPKVRKPSTNGKACSNFIDLQNYISRETVIKIWLNLSYCTRTVVSKCFLILKLCITV